MFLKCLEFIGWWVLKTFDPKSLETPKLPDECYLQASAGHQYANYIGHDSERQIALRSEADLEPIPVVTPEIIDS